jgi:hypothetical protein
MSKRSEAKQAKKLEIESMEVVDAVVVGKELKEEGGFLNPFKDGVTYEAFLNAIPEATSVDEYCGDAISEDELAWLKEELTHFKQNKK